MIKTFIIDDQSYLIEGLTTILDENPDINIVGSSTSGKQALTRLETTDVDVVILDILMPEMDGVECCRLIKEKFPDLKIIALTGEMSTGLLLKMWKQKPDGVLIKACGLDELVSSIISVYNGRKVIGQNVPPFFDVENDAHNEIPKLTKTEIEVLKLLSEGITRQEAADKMNRSMYAVEFHCKNIIRKFNNNKIHSIIAKARKARLIN